MNYAQREYAKRRIETIRERLKRKVEESVKAAYPKWEYHADALTAYQEGKLKLESQAAIAKYLKAPRRWRDGHYSSDGWDLTGCIAGANAWNEKERRRVNSIREEIARVKALVDARAHDLIDDVMLEADGLSEKIPAFEALTVDNLIDMKLIKKLMS